MPTRLVHIRKRLPMLCTHGIAVEHYPRYVNRRRTLHAVDVVLMSFIVSGRGQHVMDDAVFDEPGGSVGITHYGQRHVIVTDHEGMDVYNVYLDIKRHGLPALPAEFDAVLPEIIPLHPHLQHRLNRCVRIVFDDMTWPIALLHQMAIETKEESAARDMVLIDCLRLLLVACCRAAMVSGIRPLLSEGGPSWHRVERVRRHLDARYGDAQRLDDLAALAGLSPTHFCRVFKQHTGKRPFTYLAERRVQAAMMQLRSSSEKTVSIAHDCGFGDLSYFNRTFRRIVGCTPTAYRRRFTH